MRSVQKLCRNRSFHCCRRTAPRTWQLHEARASRDLRATLSPFYVKVHAYETDSRNLHRSQKQHITFSDTAVDPDAHNAPQWLEMTEQLLSETTVLATAREIVTAEQAIRHLTKQRTTESVDHCFKLFDKLTRRLQQHPELLDAGDLSYFFSGNQPRATHLLNAIIDAWRIQFEKRKESELLASFGTPVSILAVTEEFASRGVPLNCRTYSIIMQASLKRPTHATPVFCGRVLNRMLEQRHTMPDTVAFTTVINAWSKSARADAAHRAEQLFIELINLYEKKIIEHPPNTVTYNTVLSAMCQSKDRDMIERAHQIFTDMQLSIYPNVAPNTVSFRIMINGWTSVFQIDRACLLLFEMVRLYQTGSSDVRVDATFFSKLISEMAKSKQPHHHRRALELYQVLQRLHQETHDARFQPEIFTTRAMIIVYSKLKQPDAAEALLQRLEKQALQQRDKELRRHLLPKQGHYRDVIFAWARSTDPQAAERAERILLRMVQVLEPKPGLIDKYTLDTVLDLWCTQSHLGREQAAERAHTLLRSLESLNKDMAMDVCKLGRSSYRRVIKVWQRSPAAHALKRIKVLQEDLKQIVVTDQTTRANGRHEITLPMSKNNATERDD